MHRDVYSRLDSIKLNLFIYQLQDTCMHAYIHKLHINICINTRGAQDTRSQAWYTSNTNKNNIITHHTAKNKAIIVDSEKVKLI